MKLETVKLSQLKPYENNSRTHSAEQIEKVARSITEFGMCNPILVDSELTIIAGHARAAALKKLGHKEAPVIYLDHLTDAQKRAYVIADNQLATDAGWDEKILRDELLRLESDQFDLGLLGFEQSFLSDLMLDAEEKTRRETSEDDAPEVRETDVKRGDIYQLGKHRVMCGDSTSADDVALLMNGEKADMVFTDPPYGVNMTAKNKLLNDSTGKTRLTSGIIADDLSVSELKPIIESCFRNIESILADKSCYYVCSPQGGELGLMMMMQESGIPCRHMIVWVKNAPVFSMGRLDYDYQHEPILYGWSKNRTHQFFGKGSMTKSIWPVNREPNKLHPTMKPISLIENALLNSTESDMIIADLFGGSGSTMIAAEKTSRRARLMEIDPQYVQVIIDRYKSYTGRDDVKKL